MTDDPIICVHTGRSTWQGPASAAPRKEDRMTHDPEASERLASLMMAFALNLEHDEGRTFTAEKCSEAAALIRAQAAEIERLKALDTPAPPAEPAGDALLRSVIPPLIVIAEDNLDGMNQETREECERDIAKARAALAAAPAPIQPAPQPDVGVGSLYGDCEPFTVKNRTEMAPQPDADEREAMVAVIRRAFKGHGWLPTDLPDDTADALLAAGWTRKKTTSKALIEAMKIGAEKMRERAAQVADAKAAQMDRFLDDARARKERGESGFDSAAAGAATAAGAAGKIATAIRALPLTEETTDADA